MKHILLSAIICLALLSSFFSFSTISEAASWDGNSSATDWSGDGTSADPFLISNPAQLKGLADSVNTGTSYSGVCFKLGFDIDLANYNWTPIGGACGMDNTIESNKSIPLGYCFAGIFDGDNHTISNINISNPSSGTGAYGLFGYVNGGTLANLYVSGSLDLGDNAIDSIGAIVGYTTGSLYNLHSSMTVYMNDLNCSATQAGGIAGAVENTNSNSVVYVRYCSNTANVTGRGRVGGIVGAVYCVSNGGVVVDQCCNTGNITSSYSFTKIFSGGIVGYCRGYISNCYNRGEMTTNNGHFLAGIAGLLQGADPTASMQNCYSTAALHNYDPAFDHWLWSSADGKSTVHITNCFWLPNGGNSDLTQPNEDDSKGTQSCVSAITAAQLQGMEPLTGSNRSGAFSGYLVDNYLGATDPDNPDGAYGFGYAAAGEFPVLGWQLLTDLKVLVFPDDNYTVTFVNDGVTYTTITAASGSSIDAPAGPNEGGYRFRGWYTDPACTEAVSFPYMVTGDITLYAGWVPVWDVNGDSECNVADLVAIGLHWGETGSAGWTREDVQADGIINVLDMVKIGLHWSETW